MEGDDRKNKMIRDQRYFDSPEFQKSVSDLSQKAGMSVSFSLKPLEGGRNNKIFSIIYDNHKKFLLKAYFQHPDDQRNRVKAEYSFLNFLWDSNIRCVPKPYAADFQNNFALYEFIEGNRLAYQDITEEKIGKALNFFIDINKNKNLGQAKNLSIASEACFSIKAHLSLIGKRIKRLKKIKNDSKINKKAIIFVQEDLSKAWHRSLEHVDKFVHKYNLNPDKEISEEDKCISPSDFGFHNTLLDGSGKLFFIDFEYSGWDDPTKMVCDFFCQPEVPVPSKYFNLFVKTVVDNTSYPKKFKHQIKAILPAYKIKWCCILLNDFLDVDSKRRGFAYGKIDFRKQKINQLEKARKYLNGIGF